MQHRDPVCGMMVDSDDAIESTVGGERHYFCSTTCRDQYASDPARYDAASRDADALGAAGAHGAHSERHEPPRTTKGGITAPKFGSAGSGGAEFELLPERHENDREHKRDH